MRQPIGTLAQNCFNGCMLATMKSKTHRAVLDTNFLLASAGAGCCASGGGSHSGGRAAVSSGAGPAPCIIHQSTVPRFLQYLIFQYQTPDAIS